jgi:predicted AAA+ superfamily ATPase
MEQDLIAKGIISAVFYWPERSKNWYYAYGGRLNPDDGTLEFPPTLREKALELMNKIEDVKAGRLKVDREMDELTMALENPEHPGC